MYQPTELEIIRFCPRDRLIDRELILQVLPIKIYGQTGWLIYLFEAIPAWPIDNSSASLPGLLTGGFDRLPDQSPILGFEMVLQQANRWLGTHGARGPSQISALIALVVGREIHLSTIGKIGLLSLAHSPIQDLIPLQSAEQLTFNEVTSGHLEPTDILLVANSELAGRLLDSDWAAFTSGQDLTESLNSLYHQSHGPLAGILLNQGKGRSGSRTVFWEQTEPRLPISWPKLPRLSLPNLGSLKLIALRLADSTNKLLRPAFSFLENRLRTWLPGWRPRKLTSQPYWVWLIVAGFLIALVLLISWLVPNRPPPAPSPERDLGAELETAIMTQALIPFINDSFSLADYRAMTEFSQQNFNRQLDAIQIKLIEPRPIVELPEAINNLAVGDGGLMALSESGQIIQINAANKFLVKNSQAINKPLDFVAIDAEKFLVTDRSGDVWLVANGVNKSLALPNGLNAGGKLVEKFADQLYFLMKSDRTIWRISNFQDDLKNPIPYLINNVLPAEKVEKVEDWGINGAVIIVDSRGIISDWRRGRAGSWQVETGLRSPIRLATSVVNPIVALSHGRLIVLINQSGQIISRQMMAIDQPISDLTVDVNGQLLYLAAGREILSLPLPAG